MSAQRADAVRALVAFTLVLSLATPSLAPAQALIDGEVRRIDRDAGKMTLRHGPIPSLDMGSMTMVFRARERSMLDGLKVGQKIRFEPGKIDGQLVVLRIETAR